MKKESEFQHNLINKINAMLPGCMVLKNDPNYLQGIPDLLILYNDRWAALECKKCATASHRPNQDYYIARMNELSYAAVVYPENEEEILNELARSLKT